QLLTTIDGGPQHPRFQILLAAPQGLDGDWMKNVLYREAHPDILKTDFLIPPAQVFVELQVSWRGLKQFVCKIFAQPSQRLLPSGVTNVNPERFLDQVFQHGRRDR